MEVYGTDFDTLCKRKSNGLKGSIRILENQSKKGEEVKLYKLDIKSNYQIKWISISYHYSNSKNKRKGLLH